MDIVLSKDDFWRHLERKGYHPKEINFVFDNGKFKNILKVELWSHIGKTAENNQLEFDLEGMQQLAADITGIPAKHVRSHGVNHGCFDFDVILSKGDYGVIWKRAEETDLEFQIFLRRRNSFDHVSGVVTLEGYENKRQLLLDAADALIKKYKKMEKEK